MNDLPLDDIKRALTCHDVADKLLIDQPRKGDAICPVHKGGSLRIAETHWFCHGACKQGGDVIALHQFATGSTFMEAVKELAGWAGIAIKLDPAAVRKAETRRRSEDILHVAALFYADLYEGSPAQAYAKGRNLDVADAHLGYAPDGWHGLVDHLRTAGIDLDQAVDAGLITQHPEKKNYYDHLRGRLVIPAYKNGRCVYITGRSLDDSRDENGKRITLKFIHAALDAPPLYHLNGALKRGNQPIITESITDTLRLAAHHLPAAGLYGTAINDGQAATLRRFETLFVAAHNDKAGTAFVDRCAEHFGERIRIVPPPAPHNDWDEALAAGVEWQPDDTLTWFRWRLRAIPPNTDMIKLAPIIAPLLDYLATMDDPALSGRYLDEMRVYFAWSRTVYLDYQKQVKDHRKTNEQSHEKDTAHTGGESDMGESFAPPLFISPALCEANGVTYISQMMAYYKDHTTKRGEKRRVAVYEPILITSERRRMIPKNPPIDAPSGEITWLDKTANIALEGGFYDAPSNRWSYPSIVQFLNGESIAPTAWTMYADLMENLKRYVYHADQTSYVIDVLWAMGTYFHQLWNAFPYLALHGHKGAGKSTLLTWLGSVCFNARFLVNTSEAALYRSIQSHAPTLLIDEQEGLNNSKEAKTTKVDMMGLLKTGYKRGAKVARQRIDRPEITEYFELYSPKALAAIELFEDVLENRAILTIMNMKPDHIQLDEADTIPDREASEFIPLRDGLYLLLMQEAATIRKITERVQFAATNRFRELFKPLYVMACFVDMSRGDGKDTVTSLLDHAAKAKAVLRKDRDDLTPDAMLNEALRIVITNAVDDPEDMVNATKLSSGLIRADELQIKHAFESLFSDTRHSFFNGHWLGKQATKIEGMTKDTPPRRRREVKERDVQTNDIEVRVKQIAVYLLNPALFKS